MEWAVSSFFVTRFPNSSCYPAYALRGAFAYALQAYLDRSSPIRQLNVFSLSLFIALIALYKAVSSCTISRWIRTILAAAGIDVFWSSFDQWRRIL